ncbi:MAG: universal stress protein [Kiritimatiellae bacterium]|nr:universal stress protein [Kiritimatiellia bacterium]
MEIKLKKILCPVDFSETSDLATQYAVALARQNGASLTLLHVVAPPLAALPGETGILAVPQADINEIASACQERLGRIVGTMGAADLNVQYKVVSGVPFLEIARFARENDFDMIVMGSHGRSGLGHLLIGSVAERVVRKAPCPVLTVKDRARAGAVV